jgi:hypothetical protein
LIIPKEIREGIRMAQRLRKSSERIERYWEKGLKILEKRMDEVENFTEF